MSLYSSSRSGSRSFKKSLDILAELGGLDRVDLDSVDFIICFALFPHSSADLPLCSTNWRRRVSKEERPVCSASTAGRVYLSAELLYPGDVAVNESLQEFLRIWISDLALGIKHPLFEMDENFGLTQRRNVEIPQHIA